jgi:hypothetical protein
MKLDWRDLTLRFLLGGAAVAACYIFLGLIPWKTFAGIFAAFPAVMAAAGIAAAVMIALRPAPIAPSLPPPSGDAVASIDSEALPLPTLPTLPAQPTLPTLDITRHLGDLAMPPLPAVPSWGDLDMTGSSTTKESV